MTPNIPEDVCEMLRKITNEDIKQFHISVHDSNKKGDGFLGEMCFLNVKEKNGERDLNFVIKKAFNTESIRNAHPIRSVFLNEIFFYEKLWPKYSAFQLEYSLLKPFDKVPKYFAASTETGAEKLILENLKFSNFIVFDKKKSVDRDHIELIFKEYGKFHAISFAYREINPKDFQELANTFKDIWEEFAKNCHFSNTLKLVHETCLKALSPEKDGKIIQIYEDYVKNGYDKFRETNRYQGSYSAILHGDCWSNNMMFKYNEAGKPVDMRLLDFQCSKNGTPVYDLSYCLYSGASKDILDDLDFYLKLYHNSFSETIINFGLSPEEVYPFQALKGDWKRYCKFGFHMGLMLWRMKLTDDDHVVDLTDFPDEDSDLSHGFMQTKFDEDLFNKTARNLIVHMYENDFL